VAVCVEKGLPSEIAMGMKSVRLVVFGDSQFAANACLAGGNATLFINALEWLQERSGGVSVGDETGGVYNLRIDSDSRGIMFFLIVGAMPLGMAGMGIFVALSRRDRRSTFSPFRKETSRK
jgi:hypothetical protein